MDGCDTRRYSMIALFEEQNHFFLLNHGMSETLRGTRSVEPLRPSADLEDLTVCFALETFSETFFAAAFDLVAAFFDADFAAEVAFFAAVLDFDAAFFAAPADFLAVVLVAVFAFDAAFFAAPDALSAALAAALTFLATAALRPASWSFLEPAEATFDTVSIFALINFFAVAAPIPGSAVNFSIFELPFAAIGSPNSPCGWNTSILLLTRFDKGLT